MKQVHTPRYKIAPNKTQPENRDNKEETHLPDATTVQADLLKINVLQVILTCVD